MMEIVFSESAGGSLKQARRYGDGPFKGQAVAVFSSDGPKPNKRELLEAGEMARRKAQAAWEKSVPMGEELGDVFALPLALSVGEISGDVFGSERRDTLASLMAEAPPPLEAAAGILKEAKHNFDTVMERAKTGEELRIWYSVQPDEQCALRWLLYELLRTGKAENIRLVELPAYRLRPDGTVVRHLGWNEVSPGEWASFLPLQKKAPADLCRAMAHEWRALREENAPLRAVITGDLYSVAEDFYDPFILRELAGQANEFHQAIFIANFLGKYRFGISDGWIALRMEKMIENGILEPVTEADKDDRVIYRRYLRKRGKP